MIAHRDMRRPACARGHRLGQGALCRKAGSSPVWCRPAKGRTPVRARRERPQSAPNFL